MEREELCEWLNTLIRKTGLELADNVDITDEYREWWKNIETMEREELCEWLNTLIRKTGLELADNVDITDEYREW